MPHDDSSRSLSIVFRLSQSGGIFPSHAPRGDRSRARRRSPPRTIAHRSSAAWTRSSTSTRRRSTSSAISVGPRPTISRARSLRFFPDASEIAFVEGIDAKVLRRRDGALLTLVPALVGDTVGTLAYHDDGDVEGADVVTADLGGTHIPGLAERFMTDAR